MKNSFHIYTYFINNSFHKHFNEMGEITAMVIRLQRSVRSKRFHCFLEFEAIDVEEEEEVTSESDDEDEDDGSLRKRRLTIVNEEAAVALALGTEGRMDQNVRRKSHFYGKISRRSRKSSLFNSAAFKTRPPKPRYGAAIEGHCAAFQCN